MSASLLVRLECSLEDRSIVRRLYSPWKPRCTTPSSIATTLKSPPSRRENNEVRAIFLPSSENVTRNWKSRIKRSISLLDNVSFAF